VPFRGKNAYYLELYIKNKWTVPVIRPTVTYASETWCWKKYIIQKLLVFERKILRRIFEPRKENQIWRIKNKEEPDKLIKHENIVNYIKAQRLSWFGHIQRMPETRAARKILKWNPLTKRPRGRPTYRWEDNFSFILPSESLAGSVSERTCLTESTSSVVKVKVDPGVTRQPSDYYQANVRQTKQVR